MKKILTYLLALSVSCSAFAVDVHIAPVIISPTIIGGTSTGNTTGNAATATTLSTNPAALNSIGITGSETITALATPAAPTGTPSGTGGTVAESTTNYCSIVALDSTGKVTGTQSAAVTTTGTTSSIVWGGTPVAGAVSYQFWFSTTSGVYAKYFTSTTASFTQTAPASTGTSGTFPTGNSTGVLKVGAGTSTNNSIQMNGSVTTGFYVNGTDLYVNNGTTGIISRSTGTVYINTSGIQNTTFSSSGIITNNITGTGFFKIGAGGISVSATPPTIASGFGTSPTITATNTASMQVNVGTGGTASSGVLTFPAMTTAPICSISNPLTGAGAMTVVSAQTTTSITLTNYTISTDLALAWPASTILSILCLGL